jgi:hypothetical protein
MPGIRDHDIGRSDQPMRTVLAPGLPVGLTTEYLVRLQNALEVDELAVRAERWAREGYEFQSE